MANADKIVSVTDGAALVAKWKNEGEVVFTNDCVDILHLGHIDYLEKRFGVLQVNGC